MSKGRCGTDGEGTAGLEIEGVHIGKARVHVEKDGMHDAGEPCTCTLQRPKDVLC